MDVKAAILNKELDEEIQSMVSVQMEIITENVNDVRESSLRKHSSKWEIWIVILSMWSNNSSIKDYPKIVPYCVFMMCHARPINKNEIYSVVTLNIGCRIDIDGW